MRFFQVVLRLEWDAGEQAVYNGSTKRSTIYIRVMTIMRPALNIFTQTQIIEILDQAKRILAEIGIDVRGAKLNRGRSERCRLPA